MPATIEISTYTPADEMTGRPAHGGGNLVCELIHSTLRGRWSNSLSAIPPSQGLAAVPDIPGMYVVIEEDQKRIRLVDPLHTHRDRERILAALPRALEISGSFRPQAEQVIENLSDDRLAQWAEWMATQVELGYAVLVSGKIPKFRKSSPRPEKVPAGAETSGSTPDPENQ